jgi:hypothetical protein
MPEVRNPNINPLEALRRRSEEATEREVEGLITRIKEAREEVNAALAKLAYLSDEMRSRARRTPGDGTSSLVTFANAHARFAGAAKQGMSRTASMDRIIEKAKAEKEEATRRDIQERKWAEARRAQKQVDRLVLPTDDAFDEVFGEVVNNA